MATVYLMSGLPGCGKTTWLKNNVEGLVIHRDEIRDNLRIEKESDEYFPCPAQEEYKYWIDSIVSLMKKFPKEDIYCDQTTLNDGAAKKFYNSLFKNSYVLNCNYDFAIIKINTPLEECIKRNNKRKGYEKVPEDVIKKMNKSFKLSNIFKIINVEEA